SILGLPGKIMAFFAALIGASLPVTGFLVWWGKRKKKSKNTKKPAAKTAVAPTTIRPQAVVTE
ncbi:MAG TPA: hypothetical protein VM488_03580, partial [Pseudobacter sp.]|nr:hypothetical protein [Pseudobacter sp.]